MSHDVSERGFNEARFELSSIIGELFYAQESLAHAKSKIKDQEEDFKYNDSLLNARIEKKQSVYRNNSSSQIIPTRSSRPPRTHGVYGQ